MRFFVVGAGAIGGFLAGRLMRAGHTVTVLTRGAHLDAMRTHGLRLENAQGQLDYQGPIGICSDLREAPEVDALIVTLKSHQLSALAAPLAVAADRAGLLVQIQNGVGWWYFQGAAGPHRGHVVRSVDPDGALAGGLPADRIVPAFAFKSSQVIAPGVVRHLESPSDKWVLGELRGGDGSRLNGLAQAFTGAGLVTELGDAREWMWNKLLGNIFANPVSALTRQPLGVIARHPAARALGLQLMAELASVSSAHGCRMSMSFEERLDRGIALTNARPSMLQDLEAGRPMELDAILGATVELGQLAGVATPRIEALLACLRVVDSQAPQHVPQTV
jgi:2-dehydropantoate 2-reductase